MYNFIDNIGTVMMRSKGWSPDSESIPREIYKTYSLHWKRLFLKVMSNFDIECPDNFDKTYIKTSLFIDGYNAVLKTKGGELIVHPCMVHDSTWQRTPKYATVKSRYFDLQDMEIGRQCALAYVLPYGLSVADFINYVATKLTLLDTGIDISIMNSRNQIMVATRDKASEQTITDLFEKAKIGKPMVTYDKRMNVNKNDHEEGWNIWERSNQNYILTEQLADFQTIESMFDKWFGIPTTPEKRERVQTAEVEAYNEGNAWLKDLMLSTSDECFKKIEKMYGVRFKLVFNDSYFTSMDSEKEGNKNV